MAAAISNTDMGRGGILQLRIIGALILREMRTRFGQYQFGYAWALIEPLVQIGILSSMFYLTGARPALGNSYEAFFLTGYVSFFFFRDPASQCMGAISANRALLSFPLVRNMDTVWARIALEFITDTVALCFVIMLLRLLEIPIAPDDWLKFASGFLSMAVLGSGLGVLNSVMSIVFKPWQVMFGWFLRLQFFASGVFFIPERLPPFALDILKWNPAMHGIALTREGYYGGYKSLILVYYYPFLVGSCLALLGLTVEKLYRRRLSLR